MENETDDEKSVKNAFAGKTDHGVLLGEKRPRNGQKGIRNKSLSAPQALQRLTGGKKIFCFFF